LRHLGRARSFKGSGDRKPLQVQKAHAGVLVLARHGTLARHHTSAL